ncbi:MAG: GNAT family N-acetyltransferase [Fibrobacterota bacterium]|nr:GNAT family N-acetyltransferase [Fibrobacterota bacterium]
MIQIHLLRGEEAILPFLPRLQPLVQSAGSTFIFNRPEVPLLWWKHFQGRDGSDFGVKRGRNFLGVKTRLEEILFVVAEREDGPCGLAAMVASEVMLKANTPPLKLLSFCADSVIVFYQDLLVDPRDRGTTIAALAGFLADLAEKEGRTLFLGHIPKDSLNLPFLQAAIEDRIRLGWSGSVTENRFRGGAYPWTVHKIASAIAAIRESLPPDDAARAGLENLAARLDAQGPALIGFAGTRIAFEKEIRALCETHRQRPEAADAVAQIEGCLEGAPIQYPYLPLPKTPEAYLESLSSSRRYYFRRYLKKYGEAGADFEKIESRNITQAHVDEYLDLHMQRWGNDSVAVNTATLAFHRELCMEAARQGIFTLFFARHNGRRLVAHVCLDIGNRREYFFSGRTKDSEDLRAGKLMVMHTILDAITSGFGIYDFGYGGDEYKADFTKTYRTALSLFLSKGAMPELDRLFPKYECMRPIAG